MNPWRRVTKIGGQLAAFVCLADVVEAEWRTAPGGAGSGAASTPGKWMQRSLKLQSTGQHRGDTSRRGRR